MRYTTNVRHIPNTPLASLAHHGSYGRIGATFGQLAALIGGSGTPAVPGPSFAIYYDDPKTVSEDMLRSAACVCVLDGCVLPEPLEHAAIADGRYAVTEHVGPYERLPDAYQWVYGKWLPASGERLAAAPIIEAYMNDARTTLPPQMRTEIWMRLA